MNFGGTRGGVADPPLMGSVYPLVGICPLHEGGMDPPPPRATQKQRDKKLNMLMKGRAPATVLIIRQNHVPCLCRVTQADYMEEN
jgi:hypothetical protein